MVQLSLDIPAGVKLPGAIKYDDGKSPIFRGALAYFPRALSSIALVSKFGATKYAWNGWRYVDDGLNRYTDALVRHLATEAAGETVDSESQLLHAAHCAWNALARLELILTDRTNDQNSNSGCPRE